MKTNMYNIGEHLRVPVVDFDENPRIHVRIQDSHDQSYANPSRF